MIFHDRRRLGAILRPSTGVAVYQGPGDILAATTWWGLRAYKLSSIGTNAITIRFADGTPQSFVTVAGGGLDIASINTALVSHPGPMTIDTFFDQTGGGNHLINLGVADQPSLTLSDSTLNNLPSAGFLSSNDGGNGQFSAIAANILYTLPVTFVAVGKHTASAAQQMLLYQNSGSGMRISYHNSANNEVITYNGTVLSSTASDGSWHSLQAVIGNDPNSNMAVDGTSNIGSSGAMAAVTGIVRVGALSAGSFALDGFGAEWGTWSNTAFSAANVTAMYQQHHRYYGVM